MHCRKPLLTKRGAEFWRRIKQRMRPFATCCRSIYRDRRTAADDEESLWNLQKLLPHHLLLFLPMRSASWPSGPLTRRLGTDRPSSSRSLLLPGGVFLLLFIGAGARHPPTLSAPASRAAAVAAVTSTQATVQEENDLLKPAAAVAGPALSQFVKNPLYTI